MISPVDIGVCEEHKSNKKGGCENYEGYICFYPPPVCSLKSKNILYKMRCISQYSAQLLKNKDHSDVSESEKKRIILNRKTNFPVKD